jgi:hypothetical protein
VFFAVVPYVVFRRRGYDHTRLGRPPPGRGGVAYAVIHTFESWAVYSSPSAGLITVVFLFLQYLGPGLIKSVLTQRTGNAGVHVWAHHAIAPHVTLDTVTMPDSLDLR